MAETETMRAWADTHPSVVDWLERLEPNTGGQYLRHLYNWYHWLQTNGEEYSGKTPSELLDIQDARIGRERFKLLRMIQRFVESEKRAASTKILIYSAIRSFFLHNQIELPRDASYRMKGDYLPTKAEMSVDEFRKIVYSANRLYRAVFLVVFQGGLGENEFQELNRNWNQIGPQLEKGEKLIRVDFAGRKHSRNLKPFCSFIGGDGLDALKEYLSKERGDQGKRAHLRQ